MAAGSKMQFGVAEESTYGTPVTPSRFVEVNSEGIEFSIEAVEAESLRAGRRVQNLWIQGRRGAEGDVELPVPNQGFGVFLKHMLGAIATAQPNAGAAPTVYEHTATVGNIDGKSLTVQVGRPFNASSTVQPFTYHGGKVASWELSIDAAGFLQATLSFNCEDEDTSTALAVASYASNIKPLAYTGGTIAIGGTQIDVTDFSLEGDNGLATDRYFMRGSSSNIKKEPIEDTSLREYTGSLTAEFNDLTAYNRFVNGTEAALTANFTGDTISGAYRYAVEVTLPRVRFDGTTPTVGGPELVDLSLEFKALEPPASASPITVVYRTTDATP